MNKPCPTKTKAVGELQYLRTGNYPVNESRRIRLLPHQRLSTPAMPLAGAGLRGGDCPTSLGWPVPQAPEAPLYRAPSLRCRSPLGTLPCGHALPRTSSSELLTTSGPVTALRAFTLLALPSGGIPLAGAAICQTAAYSMGTWHGDTRLPTKSVTIAPPSRCPQLGSEAHVGNHAHCTTVVLTCEG